MRLAAIQSVCECQAKLEALLDEQKLVFLGSATWGKSKQNAPAHTMQAGGPVLHVGWLCPICGRNTMRSFAHDSLAYRERPAPVPPQAPLRSSIAPRKL